jgi:hypothetical protein
MLSLCARHVSATPSSWFNPTAFGTSPLKRGGSRLQLHVQQNITPTAAIFCLPSVNNSF